MIYSFFRIRDWKKGIRDYKDELDELQSTALQTSATKMQFSKFKKKKIEMVE